MSELMAGGGLGNEDELRQASQGDGSDETERHNNNGNNGVINTSLNNSVSSTPRRGSGRDRLLLFSSPFLSGNNSNSSSVHGDSPTSSSSDRRDSLNARGSPFLSGTFLSTTVALMQGSAPIQPITTRVATVV
jgi:hypothetical protein